MKKVLVIGPNYFHYLTAIDSAFKNMGYEVRVCGYDTPVHPYDSLAKIRWKLSKNKQTLFKKGVELFEKEVLACHNSFSPDMLLIVNGEYISRNAIEKIRKSGTKVAVWLFDNLSRLRKESFEILQCSNAVFSFDPGDVKSLISKNIDAYFLPQCCDVNTYYPIEGTVKDIDVLFVGNMYSSVRRKIIMLDVVKSFPDLNIVAFGLFQPWYKGIGLWLTRPYKSIFKNRIIAPNQVNEYYNRSKIVLNIHQESQIDGANPKVFEICGSGAYQLCDKTKYLSENIICDRIEYYESTDELKEKIKDCISHNKYLNSNNNTNYIVDNHSFENRLRIIVNHLNQ